MQGIAKAKNASAGVVRHATKIIRKAARQPSLPPKAAQRYGKGHGFLTGARVMHQ